MSPTTFSTQSLVSSLSSIDHAVLATKRAGFAASDSFADALAATLKQDRTCTVDLASFVLAIRDAEADAAARDDPRGLLASADTFASSDCIFTLTSKPSVVDIATFGRPLCASPEPMADFGSPNSIYTNSSASSRIAGLTAFDLALRADTFSSSSSVFTITSEPSVVDMAILGGPLCASSESTNQEGSMAISCSLDSMSSAYSSIASLTAFELAMRASGLAPTESEDAKPACPLANVPSVASAIESIWSNSERPYPHIDAVRFEPRAARTQLGEAWWTLPTQRPASQVSWYTYTSDEPISLETVSHLLPDTASLSAFSAIGVPGTPASHAPAAPYVSGCQTHAQQLAHLYTSVREAGVLSGALLKLISNEPTEVFAARPSPPPPMKATAAKRALRIVGTAVSRILN